MRSRFLFISLALTLFVLISLLAMRHIERQEAPGIIILTIESLRDDMVSQKLTPRLFAAAAQGGLRLPEHRAVSGWTDSTIVSLLTGLSPFRTGNSSRAHRLDPNLVTPLEQLADKGFTIAGLQPFMAMDLYANIGLTVIADSGDPLLWLARQKYRLTSFFLWYHYADTHLPQRPLDGDPKPPEELPVATQERIGSAASKAAINHQDACCEQADIPPERRLQQEAVTDFDRWFGRFWDHFQKSGLHRSTFLVVTAVHGDEHGERGLVGQASTTLAEQLHERFTRVPLFIWVPRQHRDTLPEVGTIGRSSHMDLMPTLFGLLGIEPETELDGRDLFHSTTTEGVMTSPRLKMEAHP